MKHQTKTIILLLLVGCHSCSYKQQPTSSFIQTLNRPAFPDKNPLFLNGVYSMSDCEDTHVMDSLYNINNDGFIDPIIFYGNGVFTQLGYKSCFSKEKYKFKFEDKALLTTEFIWGVYYFKDSTLHACIHKIFQGRGGSLSFWYLCNFEGTVKNNIISNWHLVEPIPNLTKLEQDYSYNQIKLKYFITPKEFTFKPFPEKTTVDSNAVWIMKYKDKK